MILITSYIHIISGTWVMRNCICGIWCLKLNVSNLSYRVALKFGLETAILYYEFMMCSSLHLNSNETIPQSCVCLHSADICSLNGFSLVGCLLSNGVIYIRGSINRIAWMVLWISVFKGSMIIFCHEQSKVWSRCGCLQGSMLYAICYLLKWDW